jgi:hypothetical protein
MRKHWREILLAFALIVVAFAVRLDWINRLEKGDPNAIIATGSRK